MRMIQLTALIGIVVALPAFILLQVGSFPASEESAPTNLSHTVELVGNNTPPKPPEIPDETPDPTPIEIPQPIQTPAAPTAIEPDTPTPIEELPEVNPNPETNESEDTPPVQPPTPIPPPIVEPFSCEERKTNSPFYYDPNMQSVRVEEGLREAGQLNDADDLMHISCTPQAIWLNGMNTETSLWIIGEALKNSLPQEKIPVFVIYNGPQHQTLEWRHIERGEPYRTWITAVAAKIGNAPAWIILEPDALALSHELSSSDRASRLAELASAVDIIRQHAPEAHIYIDAGHNKWKEPSLAADYLIAAGVKNATGFSLNVSNFQFTADEIVYAETLSALTDGAHAVIDTSRNGIGPPIGYEWCNAPGRALGDPPTMETGSSIVDALLWIKLPGESDGYCNGGTSPGTFWLSYALDLVRTKK